MHPSVAANPEKLSEFCRRWKIVELSLFGSALHDDFRPESDMDLLVSYADGAEWSLFDHLRMERELSVIFGRKVEIIARRAVERSTNPIRRKAILESARPYYVAR